MSFQIHSDSPPLRIDEHGVCRISGTRVTLEVILAAYRCGETPEAIAESYPTVPLADIYAAIAYYLKRRDEVEVYLKHAESEAGEIRRQIEAAFPAPDLREKIRARRKPLSA